MGTKITARNARARHANPSLLPPPPRRAAPIDAPVQQLLVKAPAFPQPVLHAKPSSTFSGGFVCDARGVAGRRGIVVGRTVELVCAIERAGGQSLSAGERFRVTGREGGAWRLEREGVVLRKVSSFQIRLVEQGIGGADGF